MRFNVPKHHLTGITGHVRAQIRQGSVAGSKWLKQSLSNQATANYFGVPSRGFIPQIRHRSFKICLRYKPDHWSHLLPWNMCWYLNTISVAVNSIIILPLPEASALRQMVAGSKLVEIIEENWKLLMTAGMEQWINSGRHSYSRKVRGGKEIN